MMRERERQHHRSVDILPSPTSSVHTPPPPKKWSKREEQDFFKTVCNYGVEYDPKNDKYNWAKFRTLSKLDQKSDEAFTEYYKGFLAMCKNVVGLGDNTELVVEAISEEKARRTLER